MENWIDVGSVDELSATPLKRVTVMNREFAVSYKDGKFGVLSNTCNHAGGPLGKGRLDGEYIVCPWHNPGVPEGESSLQLLQNVYRDKGQPLNVRVRCAIEALPFENPKVSAVQISHMNGQDFASALERAIQRSQAPLPLPAPKTIEHSADELKGVMPRLDRRF
jgi:hypothetical protein